MVQRPVWSGQLRLSLVAIMVNLYPAHQEGRTAFRQIHQPTGKPVNYAKVVAGLGPVESDEIRKGFEYEKGKYVLLTDEEIDAVRLDTRSTFEMTQFVGVDEVDPRYFDSAYYVTPADELNEDAYVVVRDALAQSKSLGLGQIAMRGHEHLAGIKASGRGLMLHTLHYADEVREHWDYFRHLADAQPGAEVTAAAVQLIERKSAAFDPTAFHNRYETSLRELVAAKVKAAPRKRLVRSEEPATARSGNVIDLMKSLKAALEESKVPEKAAPRPRSQRKAG